MVLENQKHAASWNGYYRPPLVIIVTHSFLHEGSPEFIPRSHVCTERRASGIDGQIVVYRNRSFHAVAHEFSQVASARADARPPIAILGIETRYAKLIEEELDLSDGCSLKLAKRARAKRVLLAAHLGSKLVVVIQAGDQGRDHRTVRDAVLYDALCGGIL